MTSFSLNLRVHGVMRFPAYIMCFVDTLQFQRLKKIRQNGNCFHVFPNANHTRFEHSLGKYAGKHKIYKTG